MLVMTIVWISLAFLLCALGIAGCIVPVLPGVALSYAGLLCLLLTPSAPSPSALIAFGIAAALVTVLDTVVPAWGARKFKSSKWGMWGCFVGTIAGMFFLPMGLLAGPFLGALAGELIAGRNLASASRSGVGALVGFLAGTFVKVLVALAMLAYLVWWVC